MIRMNKMVASVIATVAAILQMFLMPVKLWSQKPDVLDKIGIHTGFMVDREIMVPMRDGVRLSTAVLRPDNTAARMPVILIRTPYLKDQELLSQKDLYSFLLLHGYILVVQSERGTGWSEGRYQILAGARNDGYDTVTWIISQPWSNGKVGTLGCSSSGDNQLPLASLNHPAHKAMVAIASGSGIGTLPGLFSQGLFYKGGAAQVGPWSWWYGLFGSTYRPQLPRGISDDERIRLADLYSLFPAPSFALAQPLGGSIREIINRVEISTKELPSQDILRRAGFPMTDFDRLIKLAPGDPKWQSRNLLRTGDKPRVPALLVDSWYDVGAYEVVKLFEYLSDTPNQYLIMAPTAHCGMFRATENTMVGKRSMGDARYDYFQLFLNWFDYWLKGTQNGVLQRPKVQAYLMGANVWKYYASWPITGASQRRLFLHSDGLANGRLGAGSISDSPSLDEKPDSFISNPLDPVPSRGAGCCDADPAQDQASLELRKDILVYSSGALNLGMAAMGEVRAVLYVSSSTPDADLVLKLVDVNPNGEAFNLYDTVLRLRYRDGVTKPKLMVPGHIYRVELRGLVTGNYFLPGHQIRIEVAASNFPNFERNLQTGGANYDETVPRLATISVYHDSNHPSFIEFPVVPQPEK
jgi:putative CocE/NonD family hydrolase